MNYNSDMSMAMGGIDISLAHQWHYDKPFTDYTSILKFELSSNC